jgi:hypothetical protein
MSNAKPCGECTRWICIAYMIGIHYDVYYTDDDEKLKRFDYNASYYMPPDTYY